MHYALAMMNGARKVEGGDDRKIIELHAVAMALVDLEADHASAMVVRRVGHRLTRTTEVAAAVFDVLAFDQPVTSHVSLPTTRTHVQRVTSPLKW